MPRASCEDKEASPYCFCCCQNSRAVFVFACGSLTCYPLNPQQPVNMPVRFSGCESCAQSFSTLVVIVCVCVCVCVCVSVYVYVCVCAHVCVCVCVCVCVSVYVS